MTLDDAVAAVAAGASWFGDVYPLLAADDDRAALREWFVRTPGVPRNPHRPAPAAAPGPSEARQLGYTGNACAKCQGVRMVRTGPCERCNDCGETSGGCS